MSEVEVPETGPISVDDVLQAIQQKNIGRAKAAFQDVMGQKVNSALESEKVAIANQVFNPQTDIAPTAAEIAAADAEEAEETETEEELSLEDEVQAAFDEEEVEEDAEVS
jgi:hypothetical protein